MNHKIVLTFSIFFLLFISCSGDDDKPPIDSKILQILSFEFLAKDNDALTEDIAGIIDHDKKEITILLPADTSVKSLISSVTISEGATISPDPVTPTDFTNNVEYIVTGKDGVTKTTYTVISGQSESDNNRIESFVVTIDDEEYPATIEDEKITLIVPEGTAINNLRPTVGIEKRAQVSPESGAAVDFTTTVNYVVTAQNGNERIYTVDITVDNPLNRDRDVLTEFYNENLKLDNSSGIYLGWDLYAPTMNDWKGVEITEGRVTSLEIVLTVTVYDFAILGKLSELKKLMLSATRITEIPKEIGALKKLEVLNLGTNNIKTLPQEISDLVSLKELWVYGNAITEISEEIGKLSNLEVFDLSTNPITVIPKEICEMQRADGGPFLLVKDDDDTCEP
jgi:hypothetical protein